MKPYFESSPDGMKEMDDVCSTLKNKVMLDKQVEQSEIRIRLCNEIREGKETDESCDPLSGQVAEYSTAMKKDCSGFGFGIGNATFPECGTTTGSSSSSGAVAAAAGAAAATATLLSLFGIVILQ